MNFTDYLLDSVLVLLVLRQILEARLDRRAVVLPVAVVGIVAYNYLHKIPTSGNDLVLIVALTLVGITFGGVSAIFTRVRTDGGKYALVKAGWIAAGVWVLSMGSRFAFAVWASHGGGPALGRFTVAHALTPDAWTAAIVLMALGEVITRTGVLSYRAYRTLQDAPVVTPTEYATV